MKFKVAVKQLGKRKNVVEPINFEVDGEIKTVRQLIEKTVEANVKDYNARVEKGEETEKALSEQSIAEQSQVGKIAFGINYGGKKADLQEAVDTAMLAFEDGLVKIFINGSEVYSTEKEIELTEQSVVTFIRLTMLAGRMW